TFHRRDLVPVRLHREHQAGARRPAVDEHGARAADAVLAAEMGAGQAELLTQEVGKGVAGLDLRFVAAAIDRNRDPSSLRHRDTRECAFSSARAARTTASCWR